jgi:hypothetical protein
MMMQMIEKGGIPALTDNIRTPDEDNPKGYYEFEPVKKTKEDASWLDLAGGKVVKMVHVLLLDLPPDREYCVVFMRRKLEEVVASQDVMLQRGGKSTGGLTSEKVMQVFRAQMVKVDQWVRDHTNFRLLYVDYNELLANPKPEIEAISRFLGGRMNTDAMLEVVDPTLYRQRK